MAENTSNKYLDTLFKRSSLNALVQVMSRANKKVRWLQEYNWMLLV